MKVLFYTFHSVLYDSNLYTWLVICFDCSEWNIQNCYDEWRELLENMNKRKSVSLTFCERKRTKAKEMKKAKIVLLVIDHLKSFPWSLAHTYIHTSFLSLFTVKEKQPNTNCINHCFSTHCVAYYCFTQFNNGTVLRLHLVGRRPEESQCHGRQKYIGIGMPSEFWSATEILDQLAFRGPRT